MSAELVDLHVHLYGCLSPKDIWILGRDSELDSNMLDLFDHRYRKVFGRPSSYEAYWLSESGVDAIAEDYLATTRSTFAEFQAKFDLLPALFPLKPHAPLILSHVIDKHHDEGIQFIEYRCFLPPYLNDSEIDRYLTDMVHVLIDKENAYQKEIQPSLVMSIPRQPEIFNRLYEVLHSWLDAHPSYRSYIVAIDLCASEEGHPPKSISESLARVAQNNSREPKSSLAILYHVGEQYSHLSLCSSVRWVHQAVSIGAHRLGHAASLGLDSSILLGSEGNETVSERFDHLIWLKENNHWLSENGVELSSSDITKELRSLESKQPDDMLSVHYTPEYLEQFNQLQHAILSNLSKTKIIIESCPTSNSILTDAPLDQRHPLVKFKKYGLPVSIGSDDPGIFDCTLASELDLAQSLAGKLSSSARYRSKNLI